MIPRAQVIGAAFLAVLPLVARAEPAWAIDGVRQGSRWVEHDDGGRLLLVERGVLTGPRLAGHWMCETTLVCRVEVWRLDGARDYTGLNSRGQSEHTGVDARETAARLSLDFALQPAWQLTAALETVRVDRHLVATATAAGYPERWSWWSGELGGRTHGRWSGGAWQVEVLAGGLTGVRNRVQLDGLDPTVLRPRHGRRAQVGLQLDGAARWLDPAARWHIGWLRRQQRFDASEPAALTSQGVLRGGVRQPRTRLDDFTWQLGLRIDGR